MTEFPFLGELTPLKHCTTSDNVLCLLLWHKTIFFKVLVHPKVNILSLITHPHVFLWESLAIHVSTVMHVCGSVLT